MESVTDAALTSIVILTRNELEATQACVASIARSTPEPHELIFVDNGSTDDTVTWLRQLDGDVRIIENDDNLGFGAACNQGMAIARGERILLLNNDVVVTDGWLAALHRALDADAGVGLVGPRSNRVAGAQLVETPGYDVQTLEGLERFTHRWCAAHVATAPTDTLRLIGFCLLMRREVVDQIGGFDLRFGLGNFEDDDICLRAAVAGWRLQIVHDSFIHHTGSRTFRAEKIDYAAAIGEGFRQFADKWRISPEEVDPRTCSYRASNITARTPFDPSRHRSPLIARRAQDEILASADTHRSVRLLIPCDRFDPAATERALEAALDEVDPSSDVTLVVRIDPRDTTSLPALEKLADHVGDEALPDIEISELADENDLAAYRSCTHALIVGANALGTRSRASHTGVQICTSARDLHAASIRSDAA